jgi:hypothetical protein
MPPAEKAQGLVPIPRIEHVEIRPRDCNGGLDKLDPRVCLIPRFSMFITQ